MKAVRKICCLIWALFFKFVVSKFDMYGKIISDAILKMFGFRTIRVNLCQKTAVQEVKKVMKATLDHYI